MAETSLDLTIISAKGLNNVNLFGKMDVYAVVYITSDGTQEQQKQKTHVDKDGDTDPTWNCRMKFTIDGFAALHNRLNLVVKIKTGGTFGDRDVGEVYVPVKELLEGGSGGFRPLQFVTYQVRMPNGKPKGELSFSYKFGEKYGGFGKVEESVMAYPAVGTGSSLVYPPTYVEHQAPPGDATGSYPPTKEDKLDEHVIAYPAVSFGYNTIYPSLHVAPADAAYPAASAGVVQDTYPPAGGAYYPPSVGYPQAGYAYQHQPPYSGYPPTIGYSGYSPQPGYGYPSIQQPQKNNQFGLGLGAGLLGGALGGLLIGDMVSDVVDGAF